MENKAGARRLKDDAVSTIFSFVKPKLQRKDPSLRRQEAEKGKISFACLGII